MSPGFVCDSDPWVRPACAGLPFFEEHEGKRYCVLHYPGKDKSAAFGEALKKKLEVEDFDFRGVWFPDKVGLQDFTFKAPANFDHAGFTEEADFSSATFEAEANFYSVKFGARANFDSVVFKAAAFFYSAGFGAEARFDSARFDAEANFEAARFAAKARFDSATFGAPAYFPNTTFDAEADFSYAMFGAGAYFPGTTFGAEADFSLTIFKDFARFSGIGGEKVFGDKADLLLQFARIEKPERVSFHTLALRPRWFVNVDARKFEFINVDWRGAGTKRELESLSHTVSPPHRLLAIACRNLAVNAEENHRYEEASRFRYMAMEARRLERWRGFVPWRLSWWYWLASGYGERVWRACVVLIGVWLLAAALYTQVGFVRWEPRVSSEQEAWEARRDEAGRPLRWQRALTYSLGVMTLQKPEPRPATDAAQAVVMLETILGPVQAALLALAIRRKFMR
jgi:hypothetical protein